VVFACCSNTLFNAGVLRISILIKGTYIPEIYSSRSSACKLASAQLSTTMTSTPCANRLKAMSEPTKPNPPVTKIIVYYLLSAEAQIKLLLLIKPVVNFDAHLNSCYLPTNFYLCLACPWFGAGITQQKPRIPRILLSGRRVGRKCTAMGARRSTSSYTCLASTQYSPTGLCKCSTGARDYRSGQCSTSQYSAA